MLILSEFTENIKKIFSPNGLLSKAEGFEFRRQQQEMAEAIAHSLENDFHQIIEAPTGTGKSYAYLVPSILYAKQKKRKAVISTRTINLQEQLSKKDIPRIKELLNIDFKFEILKGRRNYICRNRLNQALLKKSGLFEDDEQALINKIYNIVQKEDTGELQDLDFLSREPGFYAVWESIYAEEGICTSRTCSSDQDGCFFQRAKKRVKEADLVIMNHALLFTLFGISSMNQQGFIFPDDFVIFDECHMIERIAAENISDSVSREQIKYCLNRIYNPRNRKGYFSSVDYFQIHSSVKRLIEETENFFSGIQSYIEKNYKSKSGSSEIRMLEPLKIHEEYTGLLDELSGHIRKTHEGVQNTNEENEIRNHFQKITYFKNTIRDFLAQSRKEHVYWVELSGKARKNITLKLSPVDMAEFFRTNVFTDKRLCNMTSATLSIEDSMQFFQNSIGAEEVKTLILDTPFDFSTQMEVHINSSIPEPSVKKRTSGVAEMFEDSPYEAALKERIFDYIQQTGGGVLVLCTNYKLMNKLSYYLKDRLAGSHIKIFTQGENASSDKLLKYFREDTNSILLGVDTFWMGVDVPGESLRNVIITRLPFETPDQPIVEAKMEMIESSGGNPFYSYSLPSAILKFKQGIGRLIRNRTDKGILVILDRRILTSAYGKYFVNALPNKEFIKDE